MKYGQLPTELGIFEVECKEMMFYQYLPIKMKQGNIKYEKRLNCFKPIIDECIKDFINTFGNNQYQKSYIYITAKYLFQQPNCSFNREGWHSDGFLTNDINYIWCDNNPTIFNTSKFILSENDTNSLTEMEQQANPINNITYKKNQLLRLNQFNIHKVAPIKSNTMRTFLKVSFSTDKYNLIGNSHNYNINYKWKMKPRKTQRNIPQSKISETKTII